MSVFTIPHFSFFVKGYFDPASIALILLVRISAKPQRIVTIIITLVTKR
jgi:hypothetical protein